MLEAARSLERARKNKSLVLAAGKAVNPLVSFSAVKTMPLGSKGDDRVEILARFIGQFLTALIEPD